MSASDTSGAFGATEVCNTFAGASDPLPPHPAATNSAVDAIATPSHFTPAPYARKEFRVSDFQRVKDKATGEQLSVRNPNLDRFEVLEGKAAVDRYGRRLPNKPKTSVATKATESKSKTPTNGVEPAATPEEGSAS